MRAPQPLHTKHRALRRPAARALVALTLVGAAALPSRGEAASAPLWHELGVEGRLSFPLGGGVVGRYAVDPALPLEVGVGLDTTALTWSVGGEVAARLFRTGWSPRLAVGFVHIRHTPLSESVMEENNGNAEEQGVILDVDGSWQNAVTVSAGAAWRSDGGLYLDLEVGWLVQVGESGGHADGSLTFSGWNLPTLSVALGYRWTL